MHNVTSSDIDGLFDRGEEVLPFADMSTMERPGLAQRRVGVDMTAHMIDEIDHEAQRIGVNRQALIKVWLSERLDAEKERRRQLMHA